ncbi:MAG: DUF2007 domain-containing protein [Pirellulaceae bacterium]|nr:DUF2007 domain-containing protein [Pirellulaceae bacterium]
MAADDHSLATLTTAATELQAHLVANVLREHGIEAVVTGSYTSQFRAEAPGVVRVLVRQQDLPTAESILTELGSARPAPATTDAGDDEPSDVPASDVRSRLTRWSTWALLTWALLSVAGPLVAWVATDSVSVGSTVVVITMLLLAAAIVVALAWHGADRTSRPRE